MKMESSPTQPVYFKIRFGRKGRNWLKCKENFVGVDYIPAFLGVPNDVLVALLSVLF
jgi:hypothetical protein